mmetsp:Transcript_3052/g.7622  ORF Transcript_3052/g.7622 Transcript_3052/m.7622 type:complete len:279 (+) Transcript_3052:27-863(+)
MPPKEEPQEEAEEPEVVKEKLSDTGLFYLCYPNDSGYEVGTNAVGDMTKGFFEMVSAAEASHQEEEGSSLLLQAFMRRKLARDVYGARRHLSLRLERVYRGHLGRLEFEREQQSRNRRLRKAFWDYNAALVQKIWRGFNSRKNKHNFYLRKHYLQSVAEKGRLIREQLEEHYETSRVEEARTMAAQRLENFEKVVGNLHHMASTASCSGVYNSPYHQATQATVYGMAVEEHLQNVAKGTLRESILRYGTNTGLLPEEHVQGEQQIYTYSTKPVQIRSR